jgi:hypothetical protein
MAIQPHFGSGHDYLESLLREKDMLYYLKASLVILGVVFGGLCYSSAGWAQQDQTWQLIGLEGEVAVSPSPGKPFRSAELGEQVDPGAVLETSKDGKARLFLPAGAIMALGPESSLEVGSATGLGPQVFSVKLARGSLRVYADLSSLRESSRLITIGTAVSSVEVTRGAGLLTSAANDRIIALEGPEIAVKNRISGRSLLLRPMQGVISQTDGSLETAAVKPDELENLLAKTQVAPVVAPSPAVLKPSRPAQTPITLADQVRQPWPVFPPVIQSPNIWILETERRPRPPFKPQ